MNKKQLLQILNEYIAPSFQITLSNYTKESNFYNIAFTDEVGRTMNTTWSKTRGFLNCEGSASYITLNHIHAIDNQVCDVLESELSHRLESGM